MSITAAGPAQPNSPAKPPGRFSAGRAWLAIWSIACLAALIYVGGVFYSRRQQDRDLAAQAAARQREQDQHAVEFMGGDRFEILNFYASPYIIHRGDTTDLCYGVSNAKTVNLSPPGPVWPSLSRCLQVTPKKTTIYTLTAVSASGETKTAIARIEVR